MTDRKAVIKNADMSEDMQQDAVDCATQAMEKYNIEKDIAAFIKKVRLHACTRARMHPGRADIIVPLAASQVFIFSALFLERRLLWSGPYLGFFFLMTVGHSLTPPTGLIHQFLTSWY